MADVASGCFPDWSLDFSFELGLSTRGAGAAVDDRFLLGELLALTTTISTTATIAAAARPASHRNCCRRRVCIETTTFERVSASFGLTSIRPVSLGPTSIIAASKTARAAPIPASRAPAGTSTSARPRRSARYVATSAVSDSDASTWARSSAVTSLSRAALASRREGSGVSVMMPLLDVPGGRLGSRNPRALTRVGPCRELSGS